MSEPSHSTAICLLSFRISRFETFNADTEAVEHDILLMKKCLEGRRLVDLLWAPCCIDISIVSVLPYSYGAGSIPEEDFVELVEQKISQCADIT